MTRADDPVPDGCAVNGCSLREAITEADAGPLDQDTILFDITPDTAITPTSPLPAINLPVIIDGFSDPTSDRVVLDGASLVGDGLRLAAEDSTIKGMVINDFGLDGIDITGTGNRIEGNYIGTDTSGNAAGPGNLGRGIHIQGPDKSSAGRRPAPATSSLPTERTGSGLQGPTATGNHVGGTTSG